MLNRLGRLKRLKRLNLIVSCQAHNYGISKNGHIPWHSPKEREHFHRVTTAAADGKRNAVIMGRKTSQYLGAPLEDRMNFVLTDRRYDDSSSLRHFKNFRTCFEEASRHHSVDKIFVIGGEQVYKQANYAFRPYMGTYWITMIENTTFDCDNFFPKNQLGLVLLDEEYEKEGDIGLRFQRYVLPQSIDVKP